MKPGTLSMRIKKAWPTVLQPLLSLLAVLVGAAPLLGACDTAPGLTNAPIGADRVILRGAERAD